MAVALADLTKVCAPESVILVWRNGRYISQQSKEILKALGFGKSFPEIKVRPGSDEARDIEADLRVARENWEEAQQKWREDKAAADAATLARQQAAAALAGEPSAATFVG
jgi:hypothetical protein